MVVPRAPTCRFVPQARYMIDTECNTSPTPKATTQQSEDKAKRSPSPTGRQEMKAEQRRSAPHSHQCRYVMQGHRCSQPPVVKETPQDQVVRALLAVGAQRKLGAVSPLGKVLQRCLATDLKGSSVRVLSGVANSITLQPQAQAYDGRQEGQASWA